MPYIHKIPAKHFVQMLAANVHNEKLSDEAFREFVMNTLQQVEGGDNVKMKLKSDNGNTKTYIPE